MEVKCFQRATKPHYLKALQNRKVLPGKKIEEQAVMFKVPRLLLQLVYKLSLQRPAEYQKTVTVNQTIIPLQNQLLPKLLTFKTSSSCPKAAFCIETELSYKYSRNVKNMPQYYFYQGSKFFTRGHGYQNQRVLTKTDVLPSFIYGRSAHLSSVLEISAFLGETVGVVVRARNGTLPYSCTDLLSLNFMSWFYHL